MQSELPADFCGEADRVRGKLRMFNGKEFLWRAVRPLSPPVIPAPDPGIHRTVQNQHHNAKKNLQLTGKS